MAEKKVVSYSTPTCLYCKRAKDYISQTGIPYAERNVAQDREAANEMIRKSGQMGVPVITIDDKVVVGFNQVLLDKLLTQYSRYGAAGNHLRSGYNQSTKNCLQTKQIQNICSTVKAKG